MPEFAERAVDRVMEVEGDAVEMPGDPLDIVGSLDHTGHTLIAGPGNSKFELQSYMERHKPDLASRISAVETLDDAKDSAILTMARHFFGIRGHRHATTPEPSFRHNDAPSKS